MFTTIFVLMLLVGLIVWRIEACRYKYPRNCSLWDTKIASVFAVPGIVCLFTSLLLLIGSHTDIHKGIVEYEIFKEYVEELRESTFLYNRTAVEVEIIYWNSRVAYWQHFNTLIWTDEYIPDAVDNLTLID